MEGVTRSRGLIQARCVEVLGDFLHYGVPAGGYFWVGLGCWDASVTVKFRARRIRCGLPTAPDQYHLNWAIPFQKPR